MGHGHSTLAGFFQHYDSVLLNLRICHVRLTKLLIYLSLPIILCLYTILHRIIFYKLALQFVFAGVTCILLYVL